MAISRSYKPSTDIRGLHIKPTAEMPIVGDVPANRVSDGFSKEELHALKYNPRKELILVAASSIPLAVILIITSYYETAHPWVVALAHHIQSF